MEAGPSGSFSSSASFLPDSGLTSASTSKKRARPPKSKDGSTTEENARKRAKLDASAISAPASMASASATTVPTRKPGRGARIKLPRPAKVNVAAKAALKEKARIALLTHPKWKTLPPAKLPKPRTRDARSRDAELKPRLWTGDRAEYLSIFPEMTDKRSANGICWHMYDYPTVLLDETNMCWELRKVDNLTLELFTTRTFVLPNHPTEGPELDLALSTMTLLPESEVDVKPSLDSLRAVDLAALKEGTPPRPKESLSQPKESSSQPEASSSQSSATRKKRIPKPSTPPSKPTTNALRRDRMLKVQAAIQSNCKADNERHSGAMDADRSFINDRVPTFALPRTPVARAEFDSSALQIAGQGDMKPLPELLMALDPPTSNKAASSQPKAPSSQSAAPVKKIKVPMPGAQVSKSTKNPPKRQQQLKMQATNKHQRGIDAVEPSLESMPVDSSTLDQSVTHQVKASSTQFSASIKASKPSKPAKDFSQRRHPNTRGGKQANSGGDDNHWESGVNDFPSHSRQSADSDLSHSTTTFLPATQDDVKLSLELLKAPDSLASNQSASSQHKASSTRSSASGKGIKAPKPTRPNVQALKPTKGLPRQHHKSRAATQSRRAAADDELRKSSMDIDPVPLVASHLSISASSNTNLPNPPASSSISKQPEQFQPPHLIPSTSVNSSAISKSSSTLDGPLLELETLLSDPDAMKGSTSFNKVLNALVEMISVEDNQTDSNIERIIDSLPPNFASDLLPCLAKASGVDVPCLKDLDLGPGALQPNKEILTRLAQAMQKRNGKKDILQPDMQSKADECSQTVIQDSSSSTTTLLTATQGDVNPSLELSMAVDLPVSNQPSSSQPESSSAQTSASVKATDASKPIEQASKPIKDLPNRGQHSTLRGANQPKRASGEELQVIRVDTGPEPSSTPHSRVFSTNKSKPSHSAGPSSSSRQFEALPITHTTLNSPTTIDPLSDMGILLSNSNAQEVATSSDKIVSSLANAISVEDTRLASYILRQLPPDTLSKLLPSLSRELNVDITNMRDLVLGPSDEVLADFMRAMQKRNGKKKATLQPEPQLKIRKISQGTAGVAEHEAQGKQDWALMPPPPVPKRAPTLISHKSSAKRKFEDEHSDFQAHVTIMRVETIIPGPLARPEDPLGSVLPPSQVITIPDSYKDPNIPNPIPPDVQAVIDAYVFGKPLSVVMSSTRVYEHYNLHLPKEYGCNWMGFFRVVGVEEVRLDIGDVAPIIAKGPSSGQVRWRFRLQWSPGGEDVLWRNNLEIPKQPWWVPPALKDARRSTRSSKLVPPLPTPPPEPEDEFNTPNRYRSLRTQHPEHQWRHHPLNEVYYYLFPQHLLVNFDTYLSDGNFPRGWICGTCKRVNFQKAIRHRKCTGPVCKESNTTGYKLSLAVMRDPQDRLTPGIPFNSYPRHGVKIRQARWADGTQTFSCLIPPDAPEAKISIKHIFLGNLPRLQAEANTWLDRIQLDVLVERNFGDNSPYFSYHAKYTDREANPHIANWSKLPDCVNEMKSVIIDRAKWFAEMKDDEIRVDQLDILAWVTTGNKKHPSPIRAKKKAVIFTALGCNIGITVVPRSLKGTSVSHSKSAALTEERDDDGEGTAGWIDKDQVEELVDDTNTQGQRSNTFANKRITAAAAKKDPLSMTFTMVHGDTLVFLGDDFEYSIKRDGTSFLLMGSCSDVE